MRLFERTFWPILGSGNYFDNYSVTQVLCSNSSRVNHVGSGIRTRVFLLASRFAHQSTKLVIPVDQAAWCVCCLSSLYSKNFPLVLFHLVNRKMRRKIGLDLGTRKCCVAVVTDGNVAVLPDARGDKTTPSFVAFNDCRTLVGSDAKDQAVVNCANSFYGVKSFLGRTLEDKAVDGKFVVDFGFPIFPPFYAGGDDAIVFQVEYRKEKLELRPEQIVALLIGKMKSIAEQSLGSDANSVVISVPGSFNTAQRQATLDAARIAGFQNTSLINSSTAAAVAYWDHNRKTDDCIAVIDFGAGSLSFAIISIRNGDIVVEEAFGDCNVGGNDIDLCMMDALVRKFNENSSDKFEKSPKCLMRLKFATEVLKHTLSLLPTARIQVDGVCGDTEMSMNFTRKEMVESCEEVLDVVQLGLTRLKRSKHWTKVRCAVLVGGSTRIPAVQDLISSELGILLDQSLNKDEAIACGAAVMGYNTTAPSEVQEILGRRIWYQSTEDSVIFDCETSVPDEKSHEGPLSCDMEVWENIETCDAHKKFLHDQQELEENENAMNDLEAFCFEQLEIEEPKLDKNQELIEMLNGVLQWLDHNQEATKNKCHHKRGEIEAQIRSLNPNTSLDAEEEPKVDMSFGDVNDEGCLSNRLPRDNSSSERTDVMVSSTPGSVGTEYTAQPPPNSNGSELDSWEVIPSLKPSEIVSNFSDGNLPEKTGPAVRSGSPSELSHKGQNEYMIKDRNASPNCPLVGNDPYPVWTKNTTQPHEHTTTSYQQVSYTESGSCTEFYNEKETSFIHGKNRLHSKDNGVNGFREPVVADPPKYNNNVHHKSASSSCFQGSYKYDGSTGKNVTKTNAHRASPSSTSGHTNPREIRNPNLSKHGPIKSVSGAVIRQQNQYHNQQTKVNYTQNGQFATGGYTDDKDQYHHQQTKVNYTQKGLYGSARDMAEGTSKHVYLAPVHGARGGTVDVSITMEDQTNKDKDSSDKPGISKKIRNSINSGLKKVSRWMN
ncbi:Heat shock protein 70 family [Trinorchestia longiramus]|nr:Heat shock protein 70 family [Trinorchestia longiramus]